MSPSTPNTPPRTPSRSPKKDQRQGNQTLEVGQNGFYFSIEIPQKKISTPKRTVTVISSPDKERKSETNGEGTVKDILRRNLFGTPTKKIAVSKTSVEREKEMEESNEAMMSPLKGRKRNVPVAVSRAGSSRAEEPEHPAPIEHAQDGTAMEVMTRIVVAPSPQATCHPLQSTASSSPIFKLSMTDSSIMSTRAYRTPKTHVSTPTATFGTPAALDLDLKKISITSTPSNIGHLMASLSKRSAKTQVLPTVGAPESMPTPLRKMSEKLGLTSPHVVRKSSINEHGSKESTIASTGERLKSPITFLDLPDTATVESDPVTNAPTRQTDIPPIFVESKDASLVLKELPLARLLKPSNTVTSPTVHPRPSTAAEASFSFVSTPSKPGSPMVTQRVGIPDPLGSFIQQETYNVQNSLKRSLGSGFTPKTCNTRPAMLVSSTATATHSTSSATNCNIRSTRKTARPVSMIGPAESSEAGNTQAVPRQLANTAARKPRPKSMIVGSAKMLETVVSQIDSPRERAKLRSAAAIPSSARNGPATSRPSTAMSQSVTISNTTTSGPVPKLDTTIRTTKAAPLHAAVHTARSSPSSLNTASHRRAQESASITAVSGRAAGRKNESRKSASHETSVRSKSIKSSRKRAAQSTNECTAKTPESKDPKIGSRLGQSYTPPGNPTRLPAPVKSPSKIRLAMPATPAPKKTALPSNAAKIRTPFTGRAPANHQVDPRDPNATRTPSKEIESSLDRAIDAKIAEDAMSGKEFTPSGNRISELLEAKRGLTARGRWL